jgi:hypothetical protein
LLNQCQQDGRRISDFKSRINALAAAHPPAARSAGPPPRLDRSRAAP